MPERVSKDGSRVTTTIIRSTVDAGKLAQRDRELANLRAINAELLAALQAMVERYCDDERLDSPLDERARAAIQKALP